MTSAPALYRIGFKPECAGTMDDVELRAQLLGAHAAAFGWALACCRGDHECAEDVLHDVYVSVLQRRAQFGGQAAFRTWLFGVIRVTARARRRREWLRSLVLARGANRVDLPLPQNPGDDVERDSRQARLRNAVTELSPRQREVLHLVFYQELTIEAAAMVMQVSVNSARTHYARGKARLAKLLGDLESL